MTQPPPVKIAIFASGSGTNAENITRYFQDKPVADVELTLCNKPGATVVERAQKLDVPVQIIDRKQLYKEKTVLLTLKRAKIDFIALAGFNWLVPSYIINAFEGKIVNIHPALLPQYGGKGMYGRHVHEAVLENEEQESGITIHEVNEEYDDGAIIFQETCPVGPEETPETLSEKVHQLEYEHYPKVIEQLIEERCLEKAARDSAQS